MADKRSNGAGLSTAAAAMMATPPTPPRPVRGAADDDAGDATAAAAVAALAAAPSPAALILDSSGSSTLDDCDDDDDDDDECSSSSSGSISDSDARPSATTTTTSTSSGSSSRLGSRQQRDQQQRMRRQQQKQEQQLRAIRMPPAALASGAVAAGGSVAAAVAAAPAGDTTPPAAAPAGAAPLPQQPTAVTRSTTRDGAVIERSDHWATTPDGWRLYLRRVACAAPPPGAPPPPRRAHPVVLCPGLASGGVESFDLGGGAPSLAEHLARRGFDVWVPDLRGAGRSDRARWWRRSSWFSVDDHLFLDVPAVVGTVLSVSGASELHWLGHSMGGMLAVGAISRGLACAAALRSLTLVASGCFGAGGWHQWVGPLLVRLAAPVGFHAGVAVPLLAGLRGLAAPLGALTRSLFVVGANVDAPTASRLLRSLLGFIPPAVVRQLVGSLGDPLGLASADGAWNYADAKALAHDTARPVFGLSGDRDLFCPAAGCLRTVNLFGSPWRRFLFLGPRYGTARHHHGHFCPLLGRRAHLEAFPHVAAFLEEFDAPRSSWPAGAPGAPPAPAPVAPPTPAPVAPPAGACSCGAALRR